MKILKNTLASILMLSTLATAGTFEQNGVKEGNSRISLGITSTLDNDSGSDASGTLFGEYGKFITDDIELGLYTLTTFSGSDVTYHLGVGGNYYFLKTPTLTPYVGAKYYYTDSTADVYRTDGSKIDFSSNGTNVHLGLHKFFTENFAVSPEVGTQFVDFSEYQSTYLNIYLTYFFD